jgi:hypothetical protein
MARIATRLAFALALVVSFRPVGLGSAAADGDKIFGLTKVHQIKIQLSAAEWSVLQTSAARNAGGARGTNYSQPDGRLIHVGGGFGGYFPWAHADIRVGDLELKDVGLRYKGNLSFSQSSAAAPLRASFKLKVDAYGAKGSWDGEKTLNFAAGVVDTSLMREAIAFALFRAAGVPAPRTAYAELIFTVPGIYQEASAGLFTIIEEVNKSFLKRALPPGTGLLFKPEGLRGGMQSLGENWAQYVTTLRPEREATAHEQQRVMDFGRLISQKDVALFRSKIATFLDVDQFLRYLAVNAFIENWDSYLGGSHNFFLYLDPKDDKFRFIPWDQDLSMGSRGGMGGAGFDILKPYRTEQPLIYWLLDDPAVAAQYRAIIRELAARPFSHAELMSVVDSLEKVVTGRAPSPRAYLANRASYLQQIVAAWGSK